MKYLLDVNALIASIWTDHASHPVADSWVRGKSLASCALSELGFLRISTHPKHLGQHERSDAMSIHSRAVLAAEVAVDLLAFGPDDKLQRLLHGLTFRRRIARLISERTERENGQ